MLVCSVLLHCSENGLFRQKITHCLKAAHLYIFFIHLESGSSVSASAGVACAIFPVVLPANVMNESPLITWSMCWIGKSQAKSKLLLHVHTTKIIVHFQKSIQLNLH